MIRALTRLSQAAFFSLPFDVIKSRLMDQKIGVDGKLPYANIIDCGSKIVKLEGVAALWTGFAARVRAAFCATH